MKDNHRQVNLSRRNSFKKASKANVVLPTKRLKASPIISKLIEENKLKVVGEYYELDTGAVNILIES